jgi:hypothetical protein
LFEYFKDARDLTATIVDLFVKKTESLDSEQNFTFWPEFFVEMVKLLFDINTYILVDSVGDGKSLYLFVSDMIKTEILYTSKAKQAPLTLTTAYNAAAAIASAEPADNVPAPPASRRSIVLLKRHNNVYPMFLLDPDVYFRTTAIANRTYAEDSALIKLFHSMVIFQLNEAANTNNAVDLGLLKSYTDGAPQYKITTKFVNGHEKCYAVLIDHAPNADGEQRGQIYMPIDYSANIADAIAIDFECFAPSRHQLRHADVLAFIDGLNQHIQQNNDRVRRDMAAGAAASTSATSNKRYQEISVSAYLTLAGQLIGFHDQHQKTYYFTDAASPAADIERREVMYDYHDINTQIRRHPRLTAERNGSFPRCTTTTYTNCSR